MTLSYLAVESFFLSSYRELWELIVSVIVVYPCFHHIYCIPIIIWHVSSLPYSLLNMLFENSKFSLTALGMLQGCFLGFFAPTRSFGTHTLFWHPNVLLEPTRSFGNQTFSWHLNCFLVPTRSFGTQTFIWHPHVILVPKRSFCTPTFFSYPKVLLAPTRSFGTLTLFRHSHVLLAPTDYFGTQTFFWYPNALWH